MKRIPTTNLVEKCSQLLSSDPENANLLNLKGQALCEMGKIADGMQFIRRSIQLQPNHNEAYFNLGVGLAKLQKYDEALECYNKQIDVKKNLSILVKL
jgi:tetratricopeptide (TPR) repeat protein